MIAGASMLASVVAPLAFAPFVDWAWAPGVVLACSGIVAFGLGAAGLARRVGDHRPRLATAGVALAGLAGLAAVGLLALVGTAGIAAASGATVTEPKSAFLFAAGSMAGGVSLGSLAVGAATARAGPRWAGPLLVVAGLSFLAAVAVGLARVAFGIDAPPWLVFPAVTAGASGVLAAGYIVRSRMESA